MYAPAQANLWFYSEDYAESSRKVGWNPPHIELVPAEHLKRSVCVFHQEKNWRRRRHTNTATVWKKHPNCQRIAHGHRSTVWTHIRRWQFRMTPWKKTGQDRWKAHFNLRHTRRLADKFNWEDGRRYHCFKLTQSKARVILKLMIDSKSSIQMFGLRYQRWNSLCSYCQTFGSENPVRNIEAQWLWRYR